MTEGDYQDMISEALYISCSADALYGLGSESDNRLRNGKVFSVVKAASVVALIEFGGGDGETVFITICGTNDLHDWVQNFSAQQVDVEGLQVHSGFASAANWIKRELLRSEHMDAIKQADRLVIGGHSAGGAIAQVLALEPVFTPDAVYTFGSPRVFSSKSAAKYSTYSWKVHRFVMDSDPVPGLPLKRFRWLFSGAQYAHASSPLLLGEDGSVIAYEGASGAVKVWNAIETFFLSGATMLAMWCKCLPTLLDAHRIERYRAALEKAEATNE